MLLDTEHGLKQFRHQLSEFLKSSDDTRIFLALTSGSAAPYDKFVPGLRIFKTDATTQLNFSGDGWLELVGSTASLTQLCTQIEDVKAGSHRHWHLSPVSLIIEAASQ